MTLLSLFTACFIEVPFLAPGQNWSGVTETEIRLSLCISFTLFLSIPELSVCALEFFHLDMKHYQCLPQGELSEYQILYLLLTYVICVQKYIPHVN